MKPGGDFISSGWRNPTSRRNDLNDFRAFPEGFNGGGTPVPGLSTKSYWFNYFTHKHEFNKN
jgi:hypothetical protein